MIAETTFGTIFAIALIVIAGMTADRGMYGKLDEFLSQFEE